MARALTAQGISCTNSFVNGTADALRVEASPELVGQLAHQSDVPLTELRAAEGAGLEEMFLELTAETQREGAAA